MAEIPRYMDGKKCLDIASCLPVVLRTCTCVKPIRNEPMALSLPIFSWPRACGTLKRNAPTVCIVYNCGRADDSQTAERLRKLAHSILKRCAPEEIVEQAPQWRLIEAWPYGALYVLEAVGKRLGLPEVLSEQLASRKVDFALERALFAMVANRACAPSSKLYCYEQWLREDVRIDGTDALALHHLYRAMDLLEAHKEEIEKALYFRLADLLTLDVELIFYDTTSVHFEIDEIDQGYGEDDLVEGSLAAGAKTYQAPRKRGLSKNGRSDAPQIVIGLAVTHDGLPVRHWVFPGNTVDVSTVAQVKDDLRSEERRVGKECRS